MPQDIKRLHRVMIKILTLSIRNMLYILCVHCTWINESTWKYIYTVALMYDGYWFFQQVRMCCSFILHETCSSLGYCFLLIPLLLGRTLTHTWHHGSVMRVLCVKVIFWNVNCIHAGNSIHFRLANRWSCENVVKVFETKKISRGTQTPTFWFIALILLTSPTTRQFVRQFFQSNNKETIKALHCYWPVTCRLSPERTFNTETVTMSWRHCA